MLSVMRINICSFFLRTKLQLARLRWFLEYVSRRFLYLTFTTFLSSYGFSTKWVIFKTKQKIKTTVRLRKFSIDEYGFAHKFEVVYDAVVTRAITTDAMNTNSKVIVMS